MTKNKRIVLILALTVVMLCLSLLHVKNDVCCMFASIRERGFPYPVISLAKETDSFEEAQKVYHLSDIELIRQGWELKARPISSSPIDFLSDIVLYFLASWIAISIFERIKSLNTIKTK